MQKMAIAKTRKPTREEIAAAEGQTIPDIIGPGLMVLFCGINPGLYSAAVGHHFGWPGNRFWKALYAAGFTERLLSPFEDRELLLSRYGLTNLVERATASARDLGRKELVEGRRRLEQKVRYHRPRLVAVLGIGAYRRSFGQRTTVVGEQREGIAGARLWVLPNPSGLNAHYQLEELAGLYGELLMTVEAMNSQG